MYNPNLHFHFTGIGGVGMSGIAEVLLHQGFKVSGSDLNKGEACHRLESLGAKIFEGHSAENLPENASLLVFSSAVRSTNPELVEAHKREIPVIPRAQVLAELMRLKHGIAVAGSHGKTSTTSMIAHILEAADKDPTVIVGGQVKSIGGSGAKLGKGDFLVAESDESDRSFLLLKPTIAIVTNIDSEHLEAYASMSDLEEAFCSFVESVPFYGLAVLCIDDPKVEKLAELYSRRKVTYGLRPDAEIHAKNIKSDVDCMRYDLYKDKDKLVSITLPMLGHHMVSNSLAAIAVALELGINPDVISTAISTFPGVGRRLEKVGEARGIIVINDYGHHPTEIRATLSALRSSINNKDRKLHVIFQPHRYSRTKSCFAEFLTSFGDCDNLILTEIYAASEDPIENITGESLYNALNHPSKHFVKDFKDALSIVPSLKSNDIVVCLGAGTIGQLPQLLLNRISEAGL